MFANKRSQFGQGGLHVFVCCGLGESALAARNLIAGNQLQISVPGFDGIAEIAEIAGRAREQ